jgi:beta-phosphoglucomutase-like phosphatase (HAD superfamily)
VGVQPENCVVIEDAVAGVRGAKAAGMRCIAVLTTHPAEELGSADLILEDLTELSEEVFKALMI